MPRTRVEALVVGAGLMGQWHARAIRRCGATVVAVVDPDPAAAAQLAGRCGGVPVFAELSRALDASLPDVVHVCTPLETHAGMAREALTRGCHVLAEKPLTPTEGEAAALFSLAASAGRLLAPVHQFPFQRGMLDLVARLPALGSITHVDVSMASAGATRGQRDADAVVAEILPHCLSLTRRVLGVSLRDRSWRVVRVRDGEWRITGHIDARADGSAGALSVAYFVSMSTRPTFAELRVFGERASGFADLFHGYSVIDADGGSRQAKAARPFRVAGRSLVAAARNLARRGVDAEPAYPGLNELVRQFYDAVRGQGPRPVTPEEAIDVAGTRDLLMALGRQAAAW